MHGFMELRLMGESRRTSPTQTNPAVVMVSKRTLILASVIFTVIVGATIAIKVYINSAALKNLNEKLVEMEVAQLTTNLQQEYMNKMNQNHTLYLDVDDLINLHNATKEQILMTYDNSTISSQPEIITKYRNQLSSKMDQMFVATSHELQFKQLVMKDWDLSNDIKEQIKMMYNQEFQNASLRNEGTKLIPREISPEFHKTILNLTLSKAVNQKLVPSSRKVLTELADYLNFLHTQKLADYIVLGIDFGESKICSFLYWNGEVSFKSAIDGYISVDDNIIDQIRVTHHQLFRIEDPKLLLKWAGVAVPILYDLKEVVRAWDSFKAISDKLYWTFVAHAETNDDEPLVSSPATGKPYYVKNIVSKVFQKIHNEAIIRDGSKRRVKVKKCLITVPHDFNENQRQLVWNAGKKAGFQEVTLLDEDFAAALTLEEIKGPWKASEKIMFIEFNQLSWKFHVLEGHQANYERVASGSFNQSDDFVSYCITEYCQVRKCDKIVSVETNVHWRRIYEQCESALFSVTRSSENGEVVYDSPYGFSSPKVTIYRDKLEDSIVPKLEKFTKFIDDNLKNLNLDWENITQIILGGKYGKIWVVQKVFDAYVKGKGGNLETDIVHPDNTIAYGAAVKGAIMTANAFKNGRSNSAT